MVAVLLIEPMKRMTRPGSQPCDRRGAFWPCTGGCERWLRVN